MTAVLARLYDHLAWADEQVLGALDDSHEQPAEARRMLAHLVAAEHIWLARLSGRPADMAVWPQLDVAECRRLSAATVVGYRELVARLDEAQLATVVDYQTTRGDPMSTALGDILLHVALHGAYHRGQIAALLRAADQPPPSTDFIAFTRLG
ncbi:MAG: DinB family protein [Armatimonadetes bacterium]|nr:DinB family protein [Armatimonadota bacterium]